MKEKHRGRKEDFGMGTVIIIWVAIIIAIRMAGKSMDKKMADDIRKAKGEESVSRPARASTAGGRNTAGRGMSSSAGRSYAGKNFSGAGKNSEAEVCGDDPALRHPGITQWRLPTPRSRSGICVPERMNSKR